MNIDRLTMRTAIVVGLLCFMGIARAQSATRVTPCDPATPNNAICVTWSQVTADTTGVPITGVTYRIEQKTGSAAYATASSGVTATQYYAKNLTVGTWLFRVYTNCSAAACVESLPSIAASKDASAIPIQPNAPVIIIAATIRSNGPPTYRIIQSVTLKPNEVVMVAPAAMRPLFASR